MVKHNVNRGFSRSRWQVMRSYWLHLWCVRLYQGAAVPLLRWLCVFRELTPPVSIYFVSPLIIFFLSFLMSGISNAPVRYFILFGKSVKLKYELFSDSWFIGNVVKKNKTKQKKKTKPTAIRSLQPCDTLMLEILISETLPVSYIKNTFSEFRNRVPPPPPPFLWFRSEHIQFHSHAVVTVLPSPAVTALRAALFKLSTGPSGSLFQLAEMSNALYTLFSWAGPRQNTHRPFLFQLWHTQIWVKCVDLTCKCAPIQRDLSVTSSTFAYFSSAHTNSKRLLDK